MYFWCQDVPTRVGRCWFLDVALCPKANMEELLKKASTCAFRGTTLDYIIRLNRGKMKGRARFE